VTIRNVAQLAGVSISTVSRVINSRSNVAASTAANVQRVMRQLRFLPSSRVLARSSNGNGARAEKHATIAFFVLGTSGSHPAPAFDRLLHGVSAAAAENGMRLVFSFVTDASEVSQLPRTITQSRRAGIDGLLLHGAAPAPAVQALLDLLPSVWLMANRDRPRWGDQVMPDNLSIGEMAAQYLLRRGHRHLAYLGTRAGAWYVPIRSLAFAKAADDVGARARVLQVAEQRGGDLWRADGLRNAARQLVEQLVTLDPKPTGLFVAEDRLLPAIDAALCMRGMAAPGQPFDLISCNNERPHLAGLHCTPATIDIRAESIGRRGVEQLLWRLRNPELPERVRIMIEPELIEPNEEEIHFRKATPAATAARGASDLNPATGPGTDHGVAVPAAAATATAAVASPI
jgi:DNA-binding LacI/PurR family transcriptional regulator